MNDGDKLRDLDAFLAVYEEANFTRAAARLRVSQSALSQTIQALEQRLAVRLFARTTRSVSPTEAGERLFTLVRPAMAELAAGLEHFSAWREKPSGQLRLTADEYAVQSVLLPALVPFLRAYPEIRVEIVTEYAQVDIVRQRFDAGVRRGGLVAKDMIALRIGPDVRMAVVGAPDYFATHGRPATPAALVDHVAINLRLPTHGELYAWAFEVEGRHERIKVDGPLVCSSLPSILTAALAGHGLAYLPVGLAQPHLQDGRLAQVLADWSPTFEGYHLYYPNRRQQPLAFTLLLDALRYRPPAPAAS